mgnify:CR=1 FL=1
MPYIYIKVSFLGVINGYFQKKNANLMQIFILHYYRAIPLIHYLRIYTKNDNNMNRKVIDYINSLKIIRQEPV